MRNLTSYLWIPTFLSLKRESIIITVFNKQLLFVIRICFVLIVIMFTTYCTTGTTTGKTSPKFPFAYTCTSRIHISNYHIRHSCSSNLMLNTLNLYLIHTYYVYIRYDTNLEPCRFTCADAHYCIHLNQIISVNLCGCRYLKFLTKKYLSKHRMRDWVRVMAPNNKSNEYVLRYFKIQNDDDQDDDMDSD